MRFAVVVKPGSNIAEMYTSMQVLDANEHQNCTLQLNALNLLRYIGKLNVSIALRRNWKSPVAEICSFMFAIDEAEGIWPEYREHAEFVLSATSDLHLTVHYVCFLQTHLFFHAKSICMTARNQCWMIFWMILHAAYSGLHGLTFDPGVGLE